MHCVRCLTSEFSREGAGVIWASAGRDTRRRQLQRFVSWRRAEMNSSSDSHYLLLAPDDDTPLLSITLGPIMGNAQHLAVLSRAIAALAPRGNVIGIHFV